MTKTSPSTTTRVKPAEKVKKKLSGFYDANSQLRKPNEKRANIVIIVTGRLKFARNESVSVCGKLAVLKILINTKMSSELKAQLICFSMWS